MTLEQKIHHTKQIANAIQRRELFYTIQDATPKEHIKLPTLTFRLHLFDVSL